jgi:signal transduction histidine kinase
MHDDFKTSVSIHPGLNGDALDSALAGIDPVPPKRWAMGTRDMERFTLDDAERAAVEAIELAPERALHIASIPDAVFVIDSLGAIEDVNALAETLVGYRRQDLLGKHVRFVLPDVDLAGGTGASPRDVPGGVVSATIGAQLRTRTGTIDAEVMSCRKERGSTVALVRRAKTADGLREQDVAQIVHDLKSPLATIALESELLGGSIGEHELEALGGSVHRILMNVSYMDRLVHDLLDLCALDCGQLQLHRTPTELRDLLQELIHRAVPTRDVHRVFLEVRQPITLPIDALRIERVVANLLQNAFKYAPRVSGVVVRLAVLEDRVCVSVIDAGPGIALADQPYIFDKHRRTNDARGHEGTGLGLYVSKRIIEAHGGRIGVESVHGAGSRFFFELPLA